MKWPSFFHSPEKTAPGQKKERLRRKRFHDIMATTDSLLFGVSDPVERAAILDFAVWSLGCQIAADSRGIFIHGDDPPENRGYQLNDLFTKVDGTLKGTEEIDLSKVPTYTGLWDRNRFSNGIKSVFTRGYQQRMAQNKGVFFQELRFAVMLEGRHHTSWGIFTGECVQSMQVITLEPYFPFMDTDGAFFTYTDNCGSVEKRMAIDYRLAAMYALAKQKWKEKLPAELSQRILKNRKSVERELVGRESSQSGQESMVQQLLQEQSRLRSLLYWKDEEIRCLQARCEEDGKRLRELEQCPFPSK